MQKIDSFTQLIMYDELLECHTYLYRTYTFSADEVVIANMDDNNNGELEMTVYATMNDATAVVPQATLQNAVQVLILLAWTNE